jgi:hypothetical protein
MSSTLKQFDPGSSKFDPNALLKAIMTPGYWAGNKRNPRRKIMRVEWSPSLRQYVEVLSCGHAGHSVSAEVYVRFGAPKRSLDGRGMRECGECEK